MHGMHEATLPLQWSLHRHRAAAACAVAVPVVKGTSYVSAGELFRDGQRAAAAGAAESVSDRSGGLVAAAMSASLRRAWPHTTLQDSCVLFARKFKVGSALEVDSFFSPCSMLGFNTSCLRV